VCSSDLDDDDYDDDEDDQWKEYIFTESVAEGMPHSPKSM
jgi:hypothetical protein